MNKRLKILITNDDGIDSPGIKELARVLKEFADIFVIAPDRQQSAISHAMTIALPLLPRALKINNDTIAYAINGTPVDCVKLGVSTLMDVKPDLICSGINLGPNTSISVKYSGTVAAAIEGSIQGIPSIAFSLNSFSYEQDFKPAANYALLILRMLTNIEKPNNFLLNVNIPSLKEKDIKGIKITHLSNSKWVDSYQKRVDPFGREYYWFNGDYINHDDDSDSDDNALKDGYVSITAMEINYNHTKFSDVLKKVLIIE